LSDRSPRGLVVSVRLPAVGPDRGVTGSSASEGPNGQSSAPVSDVTI
jgi:hypothetical protein